MSDNHDLHDERISKLYRMGSKEEPPKQLDDKIIQAARRTGPTRKARFNWPTLASAAVLVLSISLVLKVLNRAPLEESLPESLPTKSNPAPSSAPELKMRARASSPAPASALRDHEADSMGAAQFKSVPSGEDKMEPSEKRVLQPEAAANTIDNSPKAVISKTKRKKLACSAVPMPESASMEVWQQQYQTALEQGQTKTAECLKHGYYRKFGQAMPGLEQPASDRAP
jgi:hypothetical protein